MSLGLVGRKIGMTRVFADDGKAIPVTVLDVANNRVTQIKTPDTDGYAAVQVTWGKRRASRVAKPQAGHLAKAGVEAGTVLKEFPVSAAELGDGLLQPLRISCRQAYLGSLGDQPFSDGEPDAPASADHECHLSVEPRHALSSPARMS
jgi:hypothetical protein